MNDPPMSTYPMRFLLIDAGGDKLSERAKVSIFEFVSPVAENDVPFPSVEAIEQAAAHLPPETPRPRDVRTLIVVPLHEARSVNLRSRGAWEVTSTGGLP